MLQRITQVDAFTDKPFRGNPAAVCVLPGPRDEQWMQLVAQEMNLSETAFIIREPEGFRLRWFTPANEVALCGHATLASAHVLWEEGVCTHQEEIRFHTMSGLLTARWKAGWIELDFPRLDTEVASAPDALIEAIGLPVQFAGRSKFTWLVVLHSEGDVRKAAPDFRLLRTLDRDVLITAVSATTDYDFVSRYFAPRHAIDEDPVTGSAHCVLGPYWTERLGKSELRAFQASERGGFLRVRTAGERVFLMGQAVTVMRGDLI